MRTILVLAFALIGGTAQAQQMSRQQMMQLKSACEGDVRRLCSGIQPGGGRLLGCLQQNAANLSQPCTEALMAAKAGRPQP
ncbi:cysteine rich repeat-containing protein [Xanthobacter dioxanivorans]|uniref:Cysteine rich repeat-containing protein n=1 Tax=Xanthobacter dioxanivorans TaxID=2528964 RepID=A0A974PTL6_9HYPH|nr:cysteine rich repeat-containing protein [Xanthobacter dioxanivorans]QRG09018.1 cysteine rich repeat-containing protein [Xanthobacter dioxanivorans]